MSELGKFIKKIRLENGLNITELARKSGISRPYLSQIESGSRAPSNDLLLDLSKALGIDYSVMLGKAGRKELSDAVMYAQADYNDLVNRIKDEQGDGSFGEFVKALRSSFGYTIYDVAEKSDLPISVIKSLESNNLDEISGVLDEETLFKLSKAYNRKLLNVFYALLERAGYVEHPDYNHIDMLLDNTGTIETMQKVRELLLNKEWKRVVPEKTFQVDDVNVVNLKELLSSDKRIYYNNTQLDDYETSLLSDFIALLINHRRDSNL